MVSLAGETELLMEARYQLQSSIEQCQRPLRVTTACLIAREGRRAGDRVRDQVEVSLEKEVDVMRSQQMKMRDLLVQVLNKTKYFRPVFLMKMKFSQKGRTDRRTEIVTS